jgi:uracil-DNA glycosylase
MKEVRLILLVGQYAQKYYLEDDIKETLTETVRNFSEYLPTYFPLPHPSPRNNIWLRKNQWFAEEVIPELRKLVKKVIA